MDYVEITCRLQPDSNISEVLIALLADLGFESFVENEGEVAAYIPLPSFTDDIKQALDSPGIRDLMESYRRKTIADQNWNAVWESAYEPVVIDGRCMVRAPFHEKIGNIEFDILIMPKMSFGTAHHETTRLMVRYLLEMNLDGKSVLDMGCGTGVLAILAAMKGASPVVAIDNDEWAYENARENVSGNKVQPIEVLMGDASLIVGMHFDIVIANINRNILLSDLPAYRQCLPSKGMLLISGFYEEDLPVLREKASSINLEFKSMRTENRWTAACFEAQ